MITFAARVAIAATALVLLGACSDDGTTTSDDGTTTSDDGTTTSDDGTTTSDDGTPTSDDGTTTLAKGAVRFVGSTDLGGQTMDITAVEQDDQVTGDARFSFGLVLDLQCADTDTDGLVVLGGVATAENGDAASVGDRAAVIIREGDPDSAIVWYELPLPEGELIAGSCSEFLDSISHDQFAGDDSLVDIAEGDDIETG